MNNKHLSSSKLRKFIKEFDLNRQIYMNDPTNENHLKWTKASHSIWGTDIYGYGDDRKIPAPNWSKSQWILILRKDAILRDGGDFGDAVYCKNFYDSIYPKIKKKRDKDQGYGRKMDRRTRKKIKESRFSFE
jgi:hypothetical protein